MVPKGSSREAQGCLCVSQISHVSLLQHTDRSSECIPLYEGQVHACRRVKKREGGRRRKSGKEVTTQSALFSHFRLVSHVFASFSPSTLFPFTLPLSTEESSLSAGTRALWRWSRTVLLFLPLLSSLSALNHPSLPSRIPQPPLSTLHFHPWALRGPGSRSTESNLALNPVPSLVLMPQASLAVPLHQGDGGGPSRRRQTVGAGVEKGKDKGEVFGLYPHVKF